jgi:hypothetical protein
MEQSFEQAVIEVWRQALVENSKTVLLRSERYATNFASPAQPTRSSTRGSAAGALRSRKGITNEHCIDRKGNVTP